MLGKVLLTALLVVTGTAFAVDEDDAKVTIKGTLHGDKFGYFVHANGGVFDLIFSEAGKADMQKFYGEIKGDLVQVAGTLYVDDDGKGKPRLTVYANDISRVKRVVVTERREVVVAPPPVIVREEYVERRRHGVDLPGIHIHW
jgi:hypothetical protein